MSLLMMMMIGQCVVCMGTVLVIPFIMQWLILLVMY